MRRFRDTDLDELLASARDRRPNGVLEPFKAYLNARFTKAQGQVSGTRLFLEIQARGYRGSRQVVRKHLAALRAGTAALEAAELLPLPPTPFVLARWSTATVGPDIKIGRTLYSVPWKLIGRRVDVRSTSTMVQVFHDGSLVKTHTALDQGKRTDKSDYPPEKIAFQMRTPVWCRSQASEIGDACREVVDQLLEDNVLYRLRAAQGVLGLRKKYGETRLEAACARAIAVGDPSYRTIKGILIAGTETDPEPETSGDAGAAAFLHGPDRLFATVVTPDPTDDIHDDQVHDEAEVEAR
ncbi:hypothetical protein OG250_42290 [Streptomyces sp. NBC_00487]|uniref:Mu transposase domain-containing protein n=1 Tax=unclassified Streptomyces TaxID=2593676 RepID=UPI002E19F0BC|nr:MULTISPECIES: hypothetical protein [unclassified Streptomyces]